MTVSRKDIVGWLRWLHIYLSMFSFATLFFFAFTGITLNHTEWIEGKQVIQQVEGNLTPDLVASSREQVDELGVVEFLRNQHRIRAAVKDFTTDDTECAVSFKGPGFNADAFVDRETGAYQLTITESGMIALMNDLHKGRDTGSTWAGVIDISAGLMILVSLTGLAMIFFLKKWRLGGIVLGLIGLIVLVLIYAIFV